MADNNNNQILIVSLICLLLDIITKVLARTYLKPEQTKILIPGIIDLTLVTNSGVAFSVGQSHSLLVKIVATLVFFLLLVWFVKRPHKSRLERIGIAMVLGAALGNLSERYLHDQVTDFLAFNFISFPIFNVADVLIDVGLALVLISVYLDSRRQALTKIKR